MDRNDLDRWHIQRALELAARGEGRVEPNPMVGCVVARGAEMIGEGYHRRFGGDHAEIEALRLAGPRAAGAEVYVTLEPCCHQGKTPPCTGALIQARPARVVVGLRDPFPGVAGGGIERLRGAGIDVTEGVMVEEIRWLCGPYLKRIATGRPWVIAKWAMTLDGRIASGTGSSRWVSGESSRTAVHRLRGRVDAVIVGRETAARDDPLLTARLRNEAPARLATRVVLDSRASLSVESRLVRTARDVPVLVAAAEDTPPAERERLAAAGCEVFPCAGATHADRFDALLVELGRRGMTNVLVEGGARVLGALLDRRMIDEVHVMIAPKLIGGRTAPGPIAGEGIAEMTDALPLVRPQIETRDGDLYLRGRLAGYGGGAGAS